jgi:hypothetical protein
MDIEQGTTDEGADPLDTQIGGSHYKHYKIQPIEFFMANQLSYDTCGVIKYAMRHQNKNGLEDLRKAKHLLELMAQHYYGESL